MRKGGARWGPRLTGLGALANLFRAGLHCVALSGLAELDLQARAEDPGYARDESQREGRETDAALKGGATKPNTVRGPTVQNAKGGAPEKAKRSGNLLLGGGRHNALHAHVSDDISVVVFVVSVIQGQQTQPIDAPFPSIFLRNFDDVLA
jgi:hypothetical protein